MPVQTQFTLTDLENMPDDGIHRELIEGELIELPPPKFRHARLAHRIFKLLEKHLSEAAYNVFIEVGYKVQRDERTWIQPDVSVITSKTTQVTNDDGYLEGSPVLAVEVISPSERAQDVHRKAELTIAGGAVEVWIVYSKLKQVIVYSAEGASRPLGLEAVLSSRLGFQLPVAEIWADLTK